MSLYQEEKKNEILAKNANDTQKQHISQALVSLLNYCLVLPCNLVLFPEMSASQPFRKGSGNEPIPLQYELQSREISTISIHGVGYVGSLKRCIHAPDIPVSIFSPAHYLHWYRDTAFLYTALMAYVLEVEKPAQYGEDPLQLLQASTVITTFRANHGLYIRDKYEFIYWRPCDVPVVPLHPDISESKSTEDEAMIFMMMADTLDTNGMINVHELLAAITEISDTIPLPGAVETYDPLDHMVLNADVSIEITLRRGDSSNLITPEHDMYAVLRAIIHSGASISILTNDIGSEILRR
jgi:hypothetical protein